MLSESLPDPRALAAVFGDAPVAVVVIDREGVVRFWNGAAERMTGWRADDVLGRPPPYVPEEHLASFRARHEEAFSADEMPTITVRRRDRSGADHDIAVTRWPLRDGRGEPFAIVGVLKDVTAERRQEQAQRQAEAHLRALIERAPDGIMVHRLGQVVFVNARLVTMLGYEHAEQLVGRSVLVTVHPGERENAEARVRTAASGSQTPPQRFRLVRADGGTLFAEIIGLPIVFEGEPSVLALVRDLTERHRLETELRARDRLASVGRLAAAIGHEINNPLAYVMGNVEVALRKLDSGRDADRATVRALLTEAGEGAERVRRIVRDLRTFSQSDRDETGPVDVARVLDSCVAMAAHEIRHRARVRKGYGPLPPVLGDDARLGQVFLNLLINAAQAIPEGCADDNEIAVEARQDGGTVVVTVRDTGTGIDPAARDRLFEPFFTTKPPESGTGLGLSICRSIVSSVGGSVRLESGPGRGTIATVVLPCASHPSSDRCEGAAPVRQATACRVLVVDDEPLVASAVAALLPPGAEAVVATTGEAALARLGAGEAFDVVLCDVMMPAMSGMDVYERARGARPGIERRFVFMTGGTFTARSAQFLASVPNARLDKPFSATQLSDALALTLGAEGEDGGAARDL